MGNSTFVCVRACVRRCGACEFCTTRYDKLKEHLLKQHLIGSPPEKRVRITDLVMQNTIEPTRYSVGPTDATHGDDDDGDDGGEEVRSQVPTGS